MRPILALAFAGSLLASAPTVAHVTLDLAEAPADSYVRLAIRVPHGCAGASTTGLRLRLPEGVTAARPGVKPGWTISVVTGEMVLPPAGHGHAPVAAVREVAWHGGPLPDAHYDEFLLMIRTPARPGEIMWFPFVQECEGGAVNRWIERPVEGQPMPRMPAYGLRLTPKP